MLRFLLASVSLLLTGCEALAGLTDVAADSAMQAQAKDVVARVSSGDLWGAAAGLVGMVVTGAVTYRRVMTRRDAARQARGEPVAPPTKAAP